MLNLIEWLYPWINGFHVLSLGLLVGAITLLDLRLLGCFSRLPASQLAGPSIRVAASGLAGAILSGILLFSVQPSHYLANAAFLTKLTMVSMGILNAVLLRSSPDWRRVLRDEPASRRVRLMAAGSLVAWITAVFAGRWIAYL